MQKCLECAETLVKQATKGAKFILLSWIPKIMDLKISFGRGLSHNMHTTPSKQLNVTFLKLKLIFSFIYCYNPFKLGDYCLDQWSVQITISTSSYLFFYLFFVCVIYLFIYSLIYLFIIFKVILQFVS